MGPGRIERQISKDRWPSQHKITFFQFSRIGLVQPGADKPARNSPAQQWASLNTTASLANRSTSQPLILKLVIYAEAALCAVAQDFIRISSEELAAPGRSDAISKAADTQRAASASRAQPQTISPAAQAAIWATIHQLDLRPHCQPRNLVNQAKPAAPELNGRDDKASALKAE
jgi:hypothetical protein